MASKSAVFILFNVVLFTAANACGGGCPGKTPPPSPPPKRTPPGGGAPCPPPPSDTKCPADTLKLGVCANVLNGLINATVGRPPKEPCCSLLDGLVDLEAAVCLCTVIKANILGIKLNLPIDLSLVLNYCGKSAPKGFQCF